MLSKICNKLAKVPVIRVSCLMLGVLFKAPSMWTSYM